ncbi:hypothetical protein P20495_0156 [Pseudoalteromonas sp. BSi20495]|nr:hypothetical protein P20495_0156 [Pseudoalteromonas sp. BSi20495]
MPDITRAYHQFNFTLTRASGLYQNYLAIRIVNSVNSNKALQSSTFS